MKCICHIYTCSIDSKATRGPLHICMAEIDSDPTSIRCYHKATNVRLTHWPTHTCTFPVRTSEITATLQKWHLFMCIYSYTRSCVLLLNNLRPLCLQLSTMVHLVSSIGKVSLQVTDLTKSICCNLASTQVKLVNQC